MTAYVQEIDLFSRRASVLGAIVALHILIVYALSSGLAGKVIELVAPPIQTEIIEQIKEREAPPPMPQPEMQQPKIEIPRPEIRIEIPVERATAITNVTIAPVPARPVIAAPVVAKAAPAPRYVVHANVGKNFPNPDDFYPPSSIRMQEQGAVKVRVCIGPAGKLAEPPSVAQTSGFARLDEAALKLAKVGHYLAGSVNGVPTTECLQLPVRFYMKG